MNNNHSSGTNNLINAKSPYLLQHAHNPVNWFPWGKEALEKAKEENKPILLSIGYSSCHWCHVMAHESFENQEIADLMNANFINIKLDREERPDIDQLYMEAVQNMGLRGGWPLNVFLTPDLRPFYGGTYFPPDNWKNLLAGVSDAFQNNYDKLSESADSFAESLSVSEFSKYQLSTENPSLTDSDYSNSLIKLKKKFDPDWGGTQRSPKFPMPSVWNYLLTYSKSKNDLALQKHVLFTLDKIAAGGIYDQIGGGFSRYSVDAEWHVPHFEKMLYDNGQLMSLYAQAYKLSPKSEYKRVMIETTNWLKREMMDESGGFYSALDADSEGIEGKFYVWSKEEFDSLASQDAELLSEYFDVSDSGNWEETNVPRRLMTDKDFALKHGMSEQALKIVVEAFKEKALKHRNLRIHPGLDHKIIAGWNGLMLTGLLEAYEATEEPIFKELALKNGAFIRKKLLKEGKLLRIYNDEIPAFLEDYAAVIQAFIKHYETFFDDDYLFEAEQMMAFVLNDFFDPKENLFFFNGNSSEVLLARKKELFDNVIPSSNSIMAENLYRLGLMTDNATYKEIAEKMIIQVSPLIKEEVDYMSNWAMISLLINLPTPEIILVGKGFEKKAQAINLQYLPLKIIMGSEEDKQSPLFEYKTGSGDQAMIYVCFNKTCKLPTLHVEEALKQLD